MKALFEEITHAWYRIRRNPIVSGFKMGLIALGLGCCLAIFTIYSSVLLKPLPFPNAEKVVVIGQTDEGRGSDQMTSTNFYAHREVKERVKSLENVGFFHWFSAAFKAPGFTENLQGCGVSPEIFEILGDQAYLGHVVTQASSEKGAKRVVVISHELWQSAFAGESSVIGLPVQIGEHSFEIIGVMPASYKFIDAWEGGFSFWSLFTEADIPEVNKKSRWYATLALYPGHPNLKSLQSELTAIGIDLQNRYPEFMSQKNLTVKSLREWCIGGYQMELNILMGVGFLLLVVTTANVSQLCLAQSVTRMREFAVRMSIGAGLRHLFFTVFVEYFMITLVAGVFGALLGVYLKNQIMKGFYIFHFDVVDRDGTTFLFFLVTTVAVSLITSLIPVWQMKSVNLEASMRAGGIRMAGSSAGRRFGKILIVFEIALSSSLLILCGLLLASAYNRAHVPYKVPVEKILCGGVSMSGNRYKEVQSKELFMQQLLDALTALPEVEMAAFGSSINRRGMSGSYVFIDEKDTIDLAASTKMIHRGAASTSYFETMGLKVIRGRNFTEEDTVDKPRVVLVSQSAARRFWPDEDPIGKRVRVNHRTDDWAEIIGIVEDRYSGDPHPVLLESFWRPAHYHSFDQTEVLVRLREGQSMSRERFASVVKSIDPEMPYWFRGSLREMINENAWMTKLMTRIMVAFSILLLLITFSGIFSVVYFTVSQRMGEFSLRMALGATTQRIRMIVLSEGVAYSIMGFAVGWLISTYFIRFVDEMLYQTDSLRTANLILAASVILISTCAGCLIPAFRASSGDPLKYLRQE